MFEKSSTTKTEQQNLEGNEVVKKIRDSLEPFEYESSPPQDGMTREKRPLTTLDNGAKYDGEWDDQGRKDGQGM